MGKVVSLDEYRARRAGKLVSLDEHRDREPTVRMRRPLRGLRNVRPDNTQGRQPGDREPA